MSGSVLLLHLAGAVALLLWATRMVRTGVERAFGAALRRIARRTMGGALPSAMIGFAMALALQSSAAVALLVSAFANATVIAPVSALAAVLGADLGSALLVKVLSFDLSLLVPLSLLFGTVCFLSSEQRVWRQTGRIFVGVGLMLLALRLIGDASLPLKDGALMALATRYLAADPVIAFALAAVFAWLVHSSVATVLVIVALATQSLLPAQLAVVLVLGANLGSALIPVVLTRGGSVIGRSAPIANLLLRGTMAVIVCIAVSYFEPAWSTLGNHAGAQTVHFHLLFNAGVLLLGLLLLRPTHRFATGIAAKLQPTPEMEPLGLSPEQMVDDSTAAVPRLALASATREVLRMGEMVETMLRRIIELYEGADKLAIQQLRELDDRVDDSHANLKLFLAKVSAGSLNEEEAMRCQELIAASIRIEQVGDIVVRNMLVHVNKKQQRQLEFSDEGWREITELHASVVANAQLALNVLLSRDRETAIELIRENDRLRALEGESARLHMERLRERTASSIETSSIHLDTVRDLRLINSLLTFIAYPVLKEHGLLLDSRLSERPVA